MVVDRIMSSFITQQSANSYTIPRDNVFRAVIYSYYNFCKIGLAKFTRRLYGIHNLRIKVICSGSRSVLRNGHY